MPEIYSYTTTVQDVLDAVSRDVRLQVSNTDLPDVTILIDYINRVSKQMLRASRWRFLKSFAFFVTQRGVVNYWIGPTSSLPSDTFDTGLNLSDVRNISQVIDYSNYRPLENALRMSIAPTSTSPSGDSTPGKPRNWGSDNNSPKLIIRPAPDNQNNFAPVPSSPVVKITSGGSLPARTYQVARTIVDSLSGESVASDATEIFVPANSLLVVSPPTMSVTQSAVGVKYDRYNVYVSLNTNRGEFETGSSGLKLQNSSPVASSVSWTEPTSGLIAGINPPSQSAIEPIDGYVIYFEYFKKHVKLISPTDILQIPDDFSDILTHGVVAKTLVYLRQFDDMAIYADLYKDGIKEMIRDSNWYVDGPRFILPDMSAVGINSPANGQGDLLVFG